MGQAHRVIELYMIACDAVNTLSGTLLSHFAVHCISSYYRAVNGWLRMVVLHNMTLSHIQNREVRLWFSYKNCRFQENCCQNYISSRSTFRK